MSSINSYLHANVILRGRRRTGGKGKKQAREAREHEGSSLLLSWQFSRGRFDPVTPFFGLPCRLSERVVFFLAYKRDDFRQLSEDFRRYSKIVSKDRRKFQNIHFSSMSEHFPKTTDD